MLLLNNGVLKSMSPIRAAVVAEQIKSLLIVQRQL
jgi:hypothetical protein